MKSCTILITGFGPFPGAPFNPTGTLVKQLARPRRPVLAEVKIVSHIFLTAYAAVDRDLPKLLAKHRPDALLMFGLAPRARAVRIETCARNVLALLPDVRGAGLTRHSITPGGPRVRAMPAPARRLLAAIRTADVPVAVSRDAGRYLCNYLSWRAVETVGDKCGPKIAAFIHVPLVRRAPVPQARVNKGRLSQADLLRAGVAALAAIVVAARC